MDDDLRASYARPDETSDKTGCDPERGDQMDEKRFYWDWLKHENNIFANRSSFFLLAESALFAIIATKSPTTFIAPKWLLYTGLAITVIWLVVNIKHVFITHAMIAKKLKGFKDHPHPWHKTQNERTYKWPPIFRSHVLIGIYLPLIFLFLWIFLLYH